MQQRAAVPSFFLYGEPRRSVGPRFLHIESLEARSRPTNWRIRPHAHAELHHLFLITHGSGRMETDGMTTQFLAPCLLTMPARTVHGFGWEPETRGQVLTLADSYLHDLLGREPAFGVLFERPACLPVADSGGIAGRLVDLARELVWSAPGHAAAVDAYLLMVLVAALRLRARTQEAAARPTQAARRVARFREAVEAHYRTTMAVDEYAALLCMTAATLRRACARVAGCPPARIIQDRRFLEAQRSLLYTNMTVAEVAASLGFEDAAYFTRFFTVQAGQSPNRFRLRRGEPPISTATPRRSPARA